MNVSPSAPRAPTQSIDLNADLGEGFPNDVGLLELVTSASICCGFHAGSPEVIRQTLQSASARGVAVGAHPGYRDRDGFGRRDQNLTASQIVALITAQLDLLIKLAEETGTHITFLKPHGALYNQAQRQFAVALPVVWAAARFGLPLLGQPDSLLEATAREHGVRFVAEGFPDRRYRADGSLAPRSEPRAVLDDPAELETQVIRLATQGKVATLCIHGDDPRAVNNAQLVRKVLEQHRIAIRPFVDGPA